MYDLLTIVEEMLERDGIASGRDEDFLQFRLPFGRTAYDCAIRESMDMLVLRADWTGSISERQCQRAKNTLTRLSNAVTPCGQTFWNPAGRICYVASVDVSRVVMTPERMRVVIETLVDPFNVRLLALEHVLEGRMSEDAAVDAYIAWYRRRIGTLTNGDDIDRSLN